MKTKVALIAVLLSTTGVAFGTGGGLSIDNADVSNIVPTQAEMTKIEVQGPTDQFDVMEDRNVQIDTSAYVQTYEEINLL